MFTYDYLTKIFLLSVDGQIIGKVEKLRINVQLSFNFTSYNATLDNFDITNTGKLSLSFKANVLTDWLANILTTVVTTFLHPVIIGVIQSIVKGGLQAAVDAVNNFIHGISE
ncbi:hypothetical protein NQ317_000955 [Molorchus minor]|uniref:Uncharacterized protein n=1 Tax=Molorchus minor TaxID=1323400 RepID=A0ABQ9IQH5_9CUCU|nr:hypothetical protein NQ317_000955 [Molorchus minor]